MLYIVSTPIGNLKDITLRALDVLESVDYIVAEDTRSTGNLLKQHNISKKPFISYNDYNASKKLPRIIELVKNYSVALVSENGTPGISDPGFKLTRECKKNNIQVIPIPGPTAFLPALVSSGFPTDKFTFYGFLPKSKKKRRDLFRKVKEDKITGIFYESPHRLTTTLELLNEDYPEDEVFLAREMTKKFEEFLKDKPKELLKQKPKGEYVLVIGHSKC